MGRRYRRFALLSAVLALMAGFVSATTGAELVECADALRALTGNVFERAAISHVTAVDFGVARTFAEPELAPVPRATGLAYTVQGPRNEVAIGLRPGG